MITNFEFFKQRYALEISPVHIKPIIPSLLSILP